MSLDTDMCAVTVHETGNLGLRGDLLEQDDYGMDDTKRVSESEAGKYVKDNSRIW